MAATLTIDMEGGYQHLADVMLFDARQLRSCDPRFVECLRCAGLNHRSCMCFVLGCSWPASRIGTKLQHSCIRVMGTRVRWTI